MPTKEQIEKAWREIGDVPIDENDETSLEDFTTEFGYTFCKGSDKYDDVWTVFDEWYAPYGGVHALMFPDDHR